MSTEKKLNVEQAAAMLSCSSHTIRRMISAGTLRASRRRGGRGWILDEADVRAALEEFVPDAPVRSQRQASREHEEAVRRLKDAGIG